MKTAGKITLGLTLAALVGGVVFFGTRKAAAASSSAKAFKVSADCSAISVVDQDEAESAVRAAGIASFQGKDEKASALLERMLGVMFPACAGKINDSTSISLPGYPTASLGAIKLLLLGKSVGDMLAMAGMEGTAIAPPTPGNQSALPNPIGPFVTWLFAR